MVRPLAIQLFVALVVASPATAAEPELLLQAGLWSAYRLVKPADPALCGIRYGGTDIDDLLFVPDAETFLMRAPAAIQQAIETWSEEGRSGERPGESIIRFTSRIDDGDTRIATMLARACEEPSERCGRTGFEAPYGLIRDLRQGAIWHLRIASVALGDECSHGNADHCEDPRSITRDFSLPLRGFVEALQAVEANCAS